MQNGVVKFMTRPNIVEGWLFTVEGFKAGIDIPEWLKDKLIEGGDGRYTLANPDNTTIEVMDGQWLLFLDPCIYPATQEMVDAGFDKVTEH